VFTLKFFPNHRHFQRRFDPQANTATRNADHRHRHVIPNQDSFANLTTQYKHGSSEHARRLLQALVRELSILPQTGDRAKNKAINATLALGCVRDVEQ